MTERKVWLIEGDDIDQASRATQDSSGESTPSDGAAGIPPKRKNPARAFSLSLILWGGGQFYLDPRAGIGPALFGVMLLMWTLLGGVAFNWSAVTTYLETLGITPSLVGTMWGALFLVGLLVWIYNADHAFHLAKRLGGEGFRGVRSRFLPGFCSLLVPGWGQFLNAQPTKGALFLTVALIGFGAGGLFLLAIAVWPALETVRERISWEQMLLGTIAAAPVVLILWVVSAFDAWRVGFNEIKKESIRKRLEYANNRRRMYGWGRGLMPRARRFLILVGALVLCLGIARWSFPADFYVSRLHALRDGLSARRMVILPVLVDTIANSLREEPAAET